MHSHWRRFSVHSIKTGLIDNVTIFITDFYQLVIAVLILITSKGAKVKIQALYVALGMTFVIIL